MQEQLCKDCSMLLPPQQAVCPVCGFDNRFDQQAETLDPELIFSLRDNVVPATIHGY